MTAGPGEVVDGGPDEQAGRTRGSAGPPRRWRCRSRGRPAGVVEHPLLGHADQLQEVVGDDGRWARRSARRTQQHEVAAATEQVQGVGGGRGGRGGGGVGHAPQCSIASPPAVESGLGTGGWGALESTSGRRSPGTVTRGGQPPEQETSPYLRQHADNPVDWYPWGDEAFARARGRGRPVFLSVGYSACHWCHVMAHESFEDEPRRRRDERAVRQRQGRPGGAPRRRRRLHGGGPGHDRPGRLAHDGLPAPPTAGPSSGAPTSRRATAHGTPCFRQVVDAVDEAWRDRRGEVERQADALADAIGRRTTARRPGRTPARGPATRSRTPAPPGWRLATSSPARFDPAVGRLRPGAEVPPTHLRRAAACVAPG